jgi:chloramphenicol O-acetyltransferase type A
VFLSLVHRALAAAQQVENFRTRIVDGEVWLYQQIHGGSVVARPNGTFGFAYYRFHPDLDAFVHEAALEMERVRQRNDMSPFMHTMHSLTACTSRNSSNIFKIS